MIADPFDPFPTLTTERLVLRRIVLEDVDALYGIFSDAETVRYWGAHPYDSLDEARRLFLRIEEAYRERRGIEWAVTLRGGDGALIGKVCHHKWHKPHFRSEVGYVIDRDHRRQGIAAEAVSAIVAFGFERMALHSVEAQLDAENVASKRTLLALGFVQEGNLRESYCFEGRFTDTLIFSRLAKPA